mgnify:CR=1 FL=1
MVLKVAITLSIKRKTLWTALWTFYILRSTWSTRTNRTGVCNIHFVDLCGLAQVHKIIYWFV